MKTLTGPVRGQQASFGFAADPDLSSLHLAEDRLLRLADYVYSHSSLKPMSKTLFFLSRCLVATKGGVRPESADELIKLYEGAKARLPIRLEDDFSFATVAHESAKHISIVLEAIGEVQRLGAGTDVLGLAFNALLRGKWEGGEGLGTYLTPEEVVIPMARMAVRSVDPTQLTTVGADRNGSLFGDICGGTGRFVHCIARELLACGLGSGPVASAARLFDQSSLAVDFARVNFVLEDLYPRFERVPDSLTAEEVSDLAGQFLILATNPPFGIGKYSWSEPLAQALGPDLLSAAGIKERGDSADPAAVFLLRNLDLLADGGVLAIVLPDGLLHSSTVRASLAAFERTRRTRVEIIAMVSLPPAAFALGGTVAKTSFIIIRRRGGDRPRKMFLAEASHIGFLKRGNRRVPDPKGNDLVGIAELFGEGNGRWIGSWRQYERLAPSTLLSPRPSPGVGSGSALRELVRAVRLKAKADEKSARFHVSVLDVDETGFIDLLGASRNEPAGEGLACQPGDILVSCINPRIWRVAVVPDLPGREWSCSPEFLVLRPRDGFDSWDVALRLHDPRVAAAVRAMASGTSSSRQRVPKEKVLELNLPDSSFGRRAVQDHARTRCECYKIRLAELGVYAKIHEEAQSVDDSG